MNINQQNKSNQKGLDSNDQALREIVAHAMLYLREIPDVIAALRPDVDKWSIKEILGHLIDSAINNTRRFVIAPRLETLILDGYDQEYWVELNAYQNRDWSDIIDTWAQFNYNLSFVVGNIPEESLYKSHDEHNLNSVTFKKLPARVPATLDYFIKDYIAHVEHHLVQINGLMELSKERNI